LVRWYEPVFTNTRQQQTLEPQDVEVHHQRDGRIHGLLSVQPPTEQLEALAEGDSHPQRHPGATLQEGAPFAALLHGDGECKKMTKGSAPGGSAAACRSAESGRCVLKNASAAC
jgi:hypothetical protein